MIPANVPVPQPAVADPCHSCPGRRACRVTTDRPDRGPLPSEGHGHVPVEGQAGSQGWAWGGFAGSLGPACTSQQKPVGAGGMFRNA